MASSRPQCSNPLVVVRDPLLSSWFFTKDLNGIEQGSANKVGGVTIGVIVATNAALVDFPTKDWYLSCIVSGCHEAGMPEHVGVRYPRCPCCKGTAGGEVRCSRSMQVRQSRAPIRRYDHLRGSGSAIHYCQCKYQTSHHRYLPANPSGNDEVPQETRSKVLIAGIAQYRRWLL